jgi:PAS domain S-box-containing protein
MTVRRNIAAYLQPGTRRGGVWSVIALAAGLALTVTLARYEKNAAEREALSDFEVICRNFRLNLERRLGDYEQAVHSGVAFMAASDQVSADQWRLFCNHQEFDRRLPGMQGLGYVILLPRTELAGHVASVRANVDRDYRVWPESDREFFSSVIYLEPRSERNLRALGYDMLTEPVRRFAMEHARDIDEAVQTGKVLLVQETDKDVQAGTLVYMPVYRKGMPAETVAERRAALQGWVYGPYRIGDLMRTVREAQPEQGYRIEVFDGDGRDRSNLLYDNRGVGAVAREGSEFPIFEYPIHWAGRRWLLRFSAAYPGGLPADYTLAWLILTTGTISSLSFFGLFVSLFSARHRAHRLADELTESLRLSEERWKFAVEGSGDGVWDWDLVTNRVVYSKLGSEMLGLEGQTVGSVYDEWRQLVHPEDLPLVLAEVQAHFDGRVAVYRNEHRVRIKGGGWKWILDRGLVVSRDIAGGPARMIGTHSDITPRKHAEAALAESERNYRLLFAGMLDGFAVHEIIQDDGGRPVDYRFLSVNPAFERLTGLRAADVVGRTVLEVMPDTDPLLIERYGRVAMSGMGQEFEQYMANLHRHFEISAFSPKLGQFATVFIDITERKRAEVELHKISRTLEQAPVSIMITDTAGAIEYVNPWFTQVSGYTFEEVRGKNARILKTSFTPPEVHRDLWRSVTSGHVWRGELHNRKKSGSVYVEMAVIAPIVGPDGQVTHFSAIKDDITAQKLAEAALREREGLFRVVFDGSPIPILISTGEEGRLIEVNASTVALFGHSRDAFIGKTIEELGLWENPEQGVKFFQEIAERQSIGGVEAKMRTQSGDERIMLCSGRQIIVGGLACVLMSAIEITAVRRAESEQARMQERVFEAQKYEALGTLAGGIAHDFNNILTGVINYTALAEADCPPTHPQIKEFLGEVLYCGNRAKDLVRQILLFSRSEDAERVPLSLQHVIGEAIFLLRSTIPASVKIRTDLDKAAPVVLANATQIHQVIVNLGVNAAHAMQEQGGVLTVKLYQRLLDETHLQQLTTLAPGLHVCLEISDTGTGMDPEVVPRIFDPFFTTKKRGEGTGLGLSIVRGVVHSHEGAITVRSTAGVGTTFEILLPVLPLAAVSQDQEYEEIPRGDGQRILLVDDELTVAESLQIMLERLGYRVSMFTSPEMTLSRFRAAPDDFDVLLTDFQMPGMTGMALASAVLTQRPTMPVLVASGFSGGMTPEKMLAAGVAGFFEKPIDLYRLAVTLAKVMPR